MNDLTIRPEPAYRTTMFTVWTITTLLGTGVTALLVWLVREDSEGMIVFGVMGTLFLAVMLLTAIWIPFYTATLEYMIGERSVRMKGGVLWKRQVTVPFAKITNVDTSQGPLQRFFGIGVVHVQTAGAGGSQGGHAELRIAGVREFERIRDAIRGIIEQDRSDDGTAGGTPEPVSESAVLQAMLHELRTIRELLSNPRA